MRRSLLLGMLMVFALIVHTVEAQVRTVSGRVTASDGSGLPGVTIIVKGTSQGASTEVDGSYTLTSVPATATTLVYSFIGYATKEVALGDQTTINVTLAPRRTWTRSAAWPTILTIIITSACTPVLTIRHPITLTNSFFHLVT